MCVQTDKRHCLKAFFSFYNSSEMSWCLVWWGEVYSTDATAGRDSKRKGGVE